QQRRRKRGWRPRFRLPELRLPVLRLPPDLPIPRLRFWINLGCSLLSVFILSGAVLLSLPRLHPPPPPAQSRVVPRLAKFALPFPEVDDSDERGEMTAPDPDPPALLPAPATLPHPPPRQVAVLPPRPQARAGEPPWLRYAVPAAAALGRPQIAIVIDDLGLDKRRTERTITLPGPLTLSFMAYADDLPRMTEEAHLAGHELMVHVPMEPISRAEDMGPNGLAVGLPPDEVLRRLRWDLARFNGYVGINNHMGSRFTRDAPAMEPVIAELKSRGLLFLDSRTIGDSAGAELARRMGVPNATRDVFLDNEVRPDAIAERLAEVEQVARRHGSAIAIGHPHDATLDELQAWLRGLKAKGFELVPVSAIVRERWAARSEG
ncbi:MAG TPA: divergent polysaccharide deacetylase family protein, partial [Stellaceae bacterium]|nr:divergent polysaccharide deacetylase family protein [Stellaceae bacterium]